MPDRPPFAQWDVIHKLRRIVADMRALEPLFPVPDHDLGPQDGPELYAGLQFHGALELLEELLPSLDSALEPWPELRAMLETIPGR